MSISEVISVLLARKPHDGPTIGYFLVGGIKPGEPSTGTVRYYSCHRMKASAKS